MAHVRLRHCLPICLKKLTFSPVLAVQGMRQTGKSVLVRDLLRKKLSTLRYVTLDSPSERAFANTNPESFVTKHRGGCLAIDEAQKAPAIFDVVKMAVDESRRPGTFILLGSTEFSILTKIRESLTGRMARVRVFPLNLAEATQRPANTSRSPIFAHAKPRVSRKDLLSHLERGGMPGIFAVRNDSERLSLVEDWMALTCERDIYQTAEKKLDSDLCRRIIEAITRSEEPTTGNIARAVGATTGETKTHLKVLETLFVIQTLLPHASGKGKPFYFLADVGFAAYFNAPFLRLLQTWILQELQSQISYRGEVGTKLYYYRGSRGGIVDVIIERRQSRAALKMLASEKLDERELQGLQALKTKLPKTSLFALGGLHARVGDVEIFPWEAVG